MSQHALPNDAPHTEPEQSRQNAADYSALPDLLQERLLFESLLARLSATFIHLPAEDVDGRIEQALQQLVSFLRLDRSTLAQFSEDGTKLVVTHSYSAPGHPPFP